MESASLATMVLSQWSSVAATLWLIWWAAQTRDSPALRVIAIVVVVFPAIISPFLSFQALYLSQSQHIAMIAFYSGGIAVLHIVLLAVWAIVSKDRAYLRIGGGIIAALTVVSLIVQGIAYRLSHG